MDFSTGAPGITSAFTFFLNIFPIILSQCAAVRPAHLDSLKLSVGVDTDSIPPKGRRDARCGMCGA